MPLCLFRRSNKKVKNTNSTELDDVEFFNEYQMPIVGFGTWQASSEEIQTALNTALEVGYRHIDTAFMYSNEEAIGNVLQKWFESGRIKREDLFIVTKLPPKGMRPHSVKKYLKLSLKALKLDYVDLYLLHNPVGFQDSDELIPFGKDGNVLIDEYTDHLAIWKAMEAQVDAGRTRSIGLSNFNARQIKRIVDSARIIPANLQVELNVYFQQKELVAFCKALDITVCAYAPLGSPGFKNFLQNLGVDTAGKTFYSPLTDPVVKNIAKKHKKTAGQVLLRYIMQKEIVVIPKSSNPVRIKENFQVQDFELDADEMYELDMLDKGVKGRMFGDVLTGMIKHPEYPYNEPY